MSRSSCLWRIVALILAFVVIFAVTYSTRNNINQVTLSMGDLVTQIAQGKISSISVSDTCISVWVDYPTTTGCVQRKDTRPVTEALKEAGVSDDKIAHLDIQDAASPNPIAILIAVGFFAVVVLPPLWVAFKWLWQRLKPKSA